jgi:hypothetical protein
MGKVTGTQYLLSRYIDLKNAWDLVWGYQKVHTNVFNYGTWTTTIPVYCIHNSKIHTATVVRKKKTFDTSDIFDYSYFTRYLNVDLKIRPDIQYPACTGYPALRLTVYPAGLIRYPAKSLSGASLPTIIPVRI